MGSVHAQNVLKSTKLVYNVKIMLCLRKIEKKVFGSKWPGFTDRA